MEKITEDKITFTTTKKGEHVELRIAVAGWEGEVDEYGVNYVAPSPRRWYVVRWAHRTDEEAHDGFTLQEVEHGIFEFELESTRRAAEEAERLAATKAAEKERSRIRQEAYEAGEKDRHDWFEDYICFRLGHSLEELEEHIPEIRRIFGDPEPDPLRRGQGRGERR